MKYLLVFVAVLVFATDNVSARSYYLKASGNDAASGLSIADAWKTTAKINSTDFNTGDSILFEGSSTFDGGIYLSEEDSASIAKPLFIGSYGVGRANIYGHKSFGLYAYNVATVLIDNINFTGLSADSSSNSGIFFYTDNPLGKKYKNITLTNLDISGFQNGIQIGSGHKSYPGYSNIHLSKLRVSNNLKDGISTYDMAENTATLLAHDSVYMDHCYFGNNGFSGIVLGGINYGLIQHSKASRSGQLHNKGVVGIWVWNSKNITIQYCVADSTRTDGGDGGGFDIDGGTENCIIQYCYAYYNDGPGFMHCDYPKSRATRNNTIRYNITEADGQQPYKDKSSLAFISWGSGLSNCHIYNNTSYIGNKAKGIISGLQGNILDGFDIAPNMHNCSAINNIIYASGDSNYLVRMYNGKHFKIDTSSIKFAYNNYFATNAGSQKWYDGSSPYYNMNDWQANTLQDTYAGKKSGSNIDPQVKNPGSGGAILFRQIDSLQYLLQGYTLLKTSSLIDSGMNIKATKGLDIGSSDFYRNSSFLGVAQDIGCNESTFPSGFKEHYAAKINLFPNPFNNELNIVLEPQMIPAIFNIYDVAGRNISDGILNNTTNKIETSSIMPGSYFILINNQLKSGFTLIKME